jgi:predicted amidophosphoribosyltransferase
VTELTVDEAAASYASAMRNVLPAGVFVTCGICRTFIDPIYTVCLKCDQQPNELDAVVPISFSEHLGQLHLALRRYKDGLPQERNYAMPRLAGILWKFLDIHESCVAAAANVATFDLVTTVPSSTPENDERRSNPRTIVSWCRPVAPQYERVLIATGDGVEGRAYDRRRYRATTVLDGADVLLLDDTWTTGGHAQSSAAALRAAGARTVALVVIGRHLRREWQVVMGGPTCGELFDELPTEYDWAMCPVHSNRARPPDR